MKSPDHREQIRTDDVPIAIRTLVPEDHAIEEAFVRDLPPESRYFRFHTALPAPAVSRSSVWPPQ